ncbi:hypothetical protein BT67DRAFT_442648 [Trichocladium antarcticum]|uniref:Uncharacterized protein n=1 Tax=Trichocladium antarcticum TaxID=1450529 RepID=A0AAN6ZCZ9_9PEZI|nr:hypothetical protein BT67DRAFT_442648 [Trichocladium antarcticum]
MLYQDQSAPEPLSRFIQYRHHGPTLPQWVQQHLATTTNSTQSFSTAHDRACSASRPNRIRPLRHALDYYFGGPNTQQAVALSYTLRLASDLGEDAVEVRKGRRQPHSEIDPGYCRNCLFQSRLVGGLVAVL